MPTCYEQVMYTDTSISANNPVTCTFIQTTGASPANTIVYTISQNWGTSTPLALWSYSFFVGLLENPGSTDSPNSFEIAFTGTNPSPSGSQTTGLTVTYTPNLIVSPTLTYNYHVAGSTDTYVFKFQITNEIPTGGAIEIVFPSQYTKAPSNSLSISTISIYGTSIPVTSLQYNPPATGSVYYTNLFPDVGVTPSSSQYITITFTGVTNPNSQGTTSPFVINTYDADGYSIDQSIATTLVVSITSPAIITLSSQISASSLVVGSSVVFTVSCTATVGFNSGGWVELIVPSGYMTTTGSSSILGGGFGGFTGNTAYSYVNSTSLKLTRNLVSPISGVTISFQLGAYTLPLGVLTLPSILLYFKNPDGSIVAQAVNEVFGQITTTGGVCTLVSAVRSGTLTVGVTGGVYTLSMTCAHQILSTGRIILTIPDEQISSSSTTTSMIFKDTVNNVVIPSPTFVVTAGTQMVITIPNWLGTTINALATITIQITGGINPTYINSPSVTKISLYTQNLVNAVFYNTDSLSSVAFTPLCTPGTLTVTVARSGSTLTGGAVTYTMTVKTQTLLPVGSIIKITPPVSTVYFNYPSTSITCTLGGSSNACTATASTSDTTNIATITLPSVCSSICAAVTTFTIVISSIVNPYCVSANSLTGVSYEVQTWISSTNGLVDQTLIAVATPTSNLALTPNVLTNTLSLPAVTTPGTIVTGATTSYQFVIVNTYNKIPSLTNTGSLVIQFPETVDLQTSACTATSSSGVTLTCTGSPSAAIQSLLLTSPSDIPKGSTITVFLSNNVNNPPTGATSAVFTISTYQGTYAIDNTATLTVKADTYNNIVNAVATRSGSVTINQAFVLDITFQTTNPLPAGSVITYYFSTDEAVVLSTSSGTLVDTSSSTPVETLTFPGWTTATTPYSYYLTLTEWCSMKAANTGTGECPPTWTTALRVSTGLTNPSTAKFPTVSLQITTHTSAASGSNIIDSISSSFYIYPPCNKGSLQSVIIQKSNSVVGAATTLTVTFQTNAATGEISNVVSSVLPGYVTILFPSGFLFAASTSTTPTCTIEDATNNVVLSSSCTATIIQQQNPVGSTQINGALTIGNYVQSITANLNCGNDPNSSPSSATSCTNGQTFTFTFSGFVNPYNTLSLSGQQIGTSTLSSTGANQQIVNVLQSTIGTSIPTTDLPPACTPNVITGTVVRSSTVVGASVTATFNLVLTNRIMKGAIIQVVIPTNQFAPTGSQIYVEQYSTTSNSYGSAVLVATIATTSTSFTIQMTEWCSGTAYYCPNGYNMKFIISAGINNVGWVEPSPTGIIVTTFASDAIEEVDTVSTLIATPTVVAATNVISSIVVSTNNYAGAIGSSVDFNFQLGAPMSSTDQISLTFNAEFLRSDMGTNIIFCQRQVSGTWTDLTPACTITATNNIITNILVSGYCGTCAASTTYDLRIIGVGMRLYSGTFASSSTLIFTSQTSAAKVEGTVTSSLSIIGTLPVGQPTTTITRSVTTQGEAATFTIAWTIPGILFADSIVQLYLPLNQININSGTAFTYSNGGTPATSLAFTALSGSPTSTYIMVSLEQWITSTSVNVPSSTSFKVVITNANNPYVSTSTLTDFVIYHSTRAGSTYGATSLPIFQTASPLDATPALTFGVISPLTITQANSQYVVLTTTYTFTFTVQNNIPKAASLRFTFPPNRVLTTSPAVTPTCLIGTVAYTCSASFATTSTTITLVNLCPTAVCTGPVSMVVTVSGGIKNPNSVTTLSGNFIVDTLSLYNGLSYIVSEGIVANSVVTPILPQPITATIVRSSAYLGDQVSLIVSFTTVNAIPVGGFIQLRIAIDQATIGTAFSSCQIAYVGTAITCSEIARLTSQVVINVNSPCSAGCAAATTISLQLNSIQNPTFLSANSDTDSNAVYTMNSVPEFIDGEYSGLLITPPLVGQAAIISSISVDNTTVNQQTYLVIVFTPGADLTSQALFYFTFPDGFATLASSQVCYLIQGSWTSVGCSFTQYASGYIESVTVSGACNYGCYNNQIYVVRIAICTRDDNYPMGGTFTLVSRYPWIDVGTGSYTNSISFVPNNILNWSSWNVNCNTIQELCPMYVSFIATDPVPNASGRGHIKLVLPSEITPMINICQLAIDGNTVGTQCSITGQIVLATHSLTSITGANCTIELMQVINPPSTKPTDPILLYTEWDVLNTGVYYQIDQQLVNLTYQVTGMTPFNSVQITRLPLSSGLGLETGENTQLIFEIQLNHALTSTASFIIMFPQNAQAQIYPYYATATCYSTDYNGNLLNLLLCQIFTANSTVQIRNYCQVADCTQNAIVRFKMFDDFIENYFYIKSTMDNVIDSMGIRSTTSEGYYYIDQTNTGVFITPALQPNFLDMPSPEIIRTNNVINKKTTWVLSFKINKCPIPQGGYINMVFPAGVLIPVANSTINLLSYDTDQLYTNFTTVFSTDNSSIIQMDLYNFCNASNGCPVGGSYSLLFDWIRNPYQQLDQTTPILIETHTSQGWLAERGTTPGVNQLFSQLVPAGLLKLYIRPLMPTPGTVTDYQFLFSADVDFQSTDLLIITFPSSFNINVTTPTSRMLSAQSKCSSILDPTANVTCYINSSQILQINGLFNNIYQQYGVLVRNIQNPSALGNTDAILFNVVSSTDQAKANKQTNTQVDLVQSLNQSDCNAVCGGCAGAKSSCTSCNVPSKYPIFRAGQCVDTCGTGYFFDVQQLQCFACHHACGSCFNSGSDHCFNCTTGYYMQDGICQPYCSEGLIQNSTSMECLNSNQTTCSSNCATCSLNTSYCLSCNQESKYPILDAPSGTCIADNQNLCNGTQSSRFYIEPTSGSCQTCNELCMTCDGNYRDCTSCWSFFTKDIINELYQTCTDVCGLGTWYNNKTNECSYCNPIALMCFGYDADQVIACNKTPEGRQLYLYENMCVFECPSRYFVNTITNSCELGQANVLSFSFLFLILTVVAAVVLLSVSAVLTKRKHKFFDVAYALISCIECLNRFFLVGNLWVKTSVFALAVCFMNLIATCAIAVFFNFLFMSPIYAHSPHFRTLYKKFTCSYNAVTAISYFAGVNVMRLLCSHFMNLKQLQSDLNNWKFFLVPLNTMSNFTVIFSVFQLAINLYCILTMTPSDDAFILGILGLVINMSMIALQFLKHLGTRAFLAKSSPSTAATS